MFQRRDRDVLQEAAQLLKRVRAGELNYEKLELLGCLDYPAALEALGDDAPDPESDLKRWGKRLDAFGPEISHRMILASARVLLPLLARRGIGYEQGRTAIAAGETALRQPTPESKAAAQRAYTATIAEAVKTETDGDETCALVCAFAAHAALSPVAGTDIVADAADVASEERIRDAVQQELIPWALHNGRDVTSARLPRP